MQLRTLASVGYSDRDDIEGLDDKFTNEYLDFAGRKADEHHGLTDIVLPHRMTSVLDFSSTNPYDLSLLYRRELSSTLNDTIIRELDMYRAQLLDPDQQPKFIREKRCSIWPVQSTPISSRDNFERDLEAIMDENVVFMHKPSRQESHVDMLSMYLREHVDTTLADMVSQCSDVDQVYDVLSDIKISDLHASKQGKTVARNMQGASLDDKKKLSGELKQYKSAARTQYQTVRSMMRFIRPTVLLELEAKGINDLCEMYFDKSHTTSLYLDGTVSEKYDANPGEIVRDCTQDNPLPFYLPNVHNVKVRLDPKEEPVGCIYLLDTQDEEGVRTWHLDAVQIPVRGDWESMGSRLIDVLGQQAKARGISQITVNGDSHLISNIDYVGDALMQMRGERTAVKFPSEGRDFQGGPDQYVGGRWGKKYER